ncbi:MAG TPA: PAS domain S-box protein, partial [Opitutaceae bacterium]|nr:PAS domain S-box protein [Opitutaceae bacterium]
EMYVKLGLANSATRLGGFVYSPPETTSLTGEILRWIAIGFGIVALLGAAIVIWNFRLQRLVEQRTVALRTSEGRIRGIFKHLPVATFEEDYTKVISVFESWGKAGVTDLKGHLEEHPELMDQVVSLIHITTCNELGLQYLNATSIEHARTLKTTLAQTEVRSGMMMILEGIWSGQRKVTCEIDLPRAGMTARKCLMNWTVLETDSGDPDWSRIIVAVSDLTQLHQAEQKLQLSEDRWELAVKGLKLGLWEYDFIENRTYLSERWKEMLGYRPDEISDSRDEFWSRVHPDDVIRAKKAMEEHESGATPDYHAEIRLRRKDGSYIWIMSRGRAFFSSEGKPLRIVGAHTDISEQKAAEDALRTNESRYRLLFEANPSPMWLYDAESLRFLEVNAAAQRTYGYTREEFLGMSIMDIRSSEEQTRLSKVIRNDVATRASERGIWRHQRKDGAVLYMSVTVHGYEFGSQKAVLVLAQDVTERHLAEERLRVSESRYRTLFEGAIEGVYECEANGTFRAVNPALARMLGHSSPAEMIEHLGNGRSVYRNRARRREFLEALGSNESVTDFQSEALCADGTIKWISENVRAIRDSQGELLYLQGFVTDITERRRADSALRASEERYRVLFEYSPVAIFEYDYRSVGDWLNGLRASGVEDLESYMAEHPEALSHSLHRLEPAGMNEAAVKLVGAHSKQEVTARMVSIFTEDFHLARQRAFVGIWKGLQQIEGELALRAIDGTPRRVYYRWWLPMRAGKLDFEWTQLMLMDLTGVRRAEAALAAERERLSVTLRAMAEGVVTTDTQGTVLFINHAAEELVGWRLGSAIGRRIEEVVMMRNQKTQAPVMVPVAAALGRHGVVDLPLQTNLVDRSGVVRIVEGRCAPLFDGQSLPLGVVLVLRDISERARLENEILRASKLESVGILAGGIAHDFNNILTVVMGNLTLAQLEVAATSKTARWLQEAERGAMRARDLTQQLLTFAKGGDPVRSAVRLPEVVKDSAAFALHGSTVSCEVEADKDLWPADIDKGQIGQVVQNLVINAVQAMPNGGKLVIVMHNDASPSGAAKANARPGARFIRISITDTGSGIRPEHIGRIFDPYFTTKQSGSGLGLATVYSIVRKHQGHIEVESELGKGTTFRIWLPAATEAPTSPQASGLSVEKLTGRVLFMDDEETIRRLAQTLLVRLGFEVVTVSDGAAAVRQYQEAMEAGVPYRVVVMDLTVPGGMGGKQAMEELLKVDPNVRAIVSSGYSSDPVLANHQAHGFKGVVAKPYRIADLARVMRMVIEEN